MSLTDPSFTDGKVAVLDPLVECLNLTGDGTTYQRYDYISDTIDREAVEKEFADADGHPLGSDTREGMQKGAISLLKHKASHKSPAPGHIIHLDVGDGSEYYIAGKPGNGRTRNEQSRFSVNVKRAYNPIVVSLLSEAYGQRFIFTQAEGTLAGDLTSALVAVNTRTGATLTWSLAAKPGYTVPGWLSINSSTGALSGTAAAGSWELEIILTDVLAGQETRRGFGTLSLVITA